LENGYVTEEDLIEENLTVWGEMRKQLFIIYKFAMTRCRNSYIDCCEMDLSLFLDYLLFELELEDSQEERR